VKDGKLYNLQLHEQRLNNARFEIFGDSQKINLAQQIEIPTAARKGLHKCRIVYNEQIQSINFTPYQLKKIKSLQLVHHNQIDYHHKYENRSTLNLLYKKRGKADDIIIIKNGKVTDAYYANLVFWDGSDYVTSDTPLLHGIKRQLLIESGLVKVETIKVENLAKYKEVHLVNAFLDLGRVVVKSENIFHSSVVANTGPSKL